MYNETLLTVPLLVTSMLSVGLAIIIWKMSSLRSKWPFICLLIANTSLSITYLLELKSSTLDEKLFWNDLEYISNVTIPPLFLLFTMTFVGQDKALKWQRIALLFSFPTITLGMVWSNDIHHLFYTAVTLSGAPYMEPYIPTYGPWFYLYTCCVVLMVALSFSVLLRSYFKSAPVLRKQIFTVMLSSILALGVFFVGFSGFLPVPFTFLVNMAFMISTTLIFIGAYRYELFNVMPMALDTVVEKMKDGVVVLDSRLNVVHLNPSAAQMLGMVHRRKQSLSSREILPFLEEEDLENAIEPVRSIEVSIPQNEQDHFYNIQITVMKDQSGERTGVHLILRDIDEERRMKDQIRQANTKLSIMSMVVRHDTLNQLGVIHGYGDLISTGLLKAEDVKKYSDRIQEAVKYIESQFNFATDYQNLGSSDPVWQWMQFVLARAKTSGASEGFTVLADLGVLNVLADPMFEKVFTILLNNSRKHGKKTTCIKIGYRVENGSCVITYEDNGVGIPSAQKKAVFEKDFDPHGGLGLYVARQIMMISGGTIQEVGVEGEGARFELVFPEGYWKEEKFNSSDLTRELGTAKVG